MYDQLPYNQENDKRYDLIEFVENPEPRCPYIVLVDSSASMEGEPINELYNGLKIFKQELLNNELAAKRVELAVISFNSNASVLTDGFVNPMEFNPMPIKTDGATRMCDAIKLAVSIAEARKEQYKEAGIGYYRPWIVLITDGNPTDEYGNCLEYDSKEFLEVANMVKTGNDDKSFSFFAIGVGEYVDMEALTRICPANRPPKKLAGLKFYELFKWLSNSAKSRSNSAVGEKCPISPTDGWSED